MSNHHSYGCVHRASNSGPTTSGMPMLQTVPAGFGCSRNSPSEMLKEQIHQTHLSYLNQDDTPEKLDQKTKLEGLIVEYLSVVPHNRKFSHAEIGECLDESIRNASFSAYKAAMAFEMIEKFAVNLLTKPWRKEYRVIYPYGGYFKHMVQKQLSRCEYILYLMGYEQPSSSHSIISLNDAPLDPDRLASVALDCLIAFVECQILIQIRDALKRKSVFVTWLDVYNIRTKYVCGMDEVVKLECELKRNELIDYKGGHPVPSLSSKYSSSSSYDKMNPPRASWTPTESSQSLKRSSHTHKVNAYNNENDSFVNDSFDLMHFPLPMEQPLHVTIPSYGNVASIPYITPPPPPMFASSAMDPLSNKYKPQKVSRSTQVGTNVDNLGTTFLQLNLQQGQSNDPLRNEDFTANALVDVPSSTTKSDQSKVGAYSFFYDTPDAPYLEKKTLEKVHRKASLDNSKKQSHPLSSKSEVVKAAKAGTISFSSPAVVKTHKSVAAASINEAQDSKWSCSSCTYLNTGNDEICQMCSRSKEKGPEVMPLMSGGKECPRCTLVNDKNMKFCKACETDLLDSPTYI